MFRIKICGVTTAKDAQLIALAGADAIGLNFYPESPRYVEPAAAEKIAVGIPPKLARVGVFVNSPAEYIQEIATRLKLDWIQLHGDELPDTVSNLAGRSVLKAFRIGSGTDRWEAARDFLQQCRGRGASPSAVLLDASIPGEFGGTGQTMDWADIANHKAMLDGLPLVLAGGLTPFNVGDAIAAARPNAVDVASGVESKPGTKDLMLIRAFVTSAKKALDAVGSP